MLFRSWADIVEQDYDWLSFFTNENMINDRVKIHHRDIKQINQNGKSCYVYNDFGSVVSGNKYTVISIDGPWGSKEISRIDVIDYIPELLDESFAILLDDYHKPGEQAMVRMLSEKLNSCGILHSIKSYGGEKAMAIIVSENNRFLCSLFNLIPNELEPFDHDTFINSGTKFLVGVTNCDTGLPEFYNIKDFNEDGYESLKASISLPLVAKVVEFDNKKLMDGGIAAPIPIQKAIEDAIPRRF